MNAIKDIVASNTHICVAFLSFAIGGGGVYFIMKFTQGKVQTPQRQEHQQLTVSSTTSVSTSAPDPMPSTSDTTDPVTPVDEEFHDTFSSKYKTKRPADIQPPGSNEPGPLSKKITPEHKIIYHAPEALGTYAPLGATMSLHEAIERSRPMGEQGAPCQTTTSSAQANPAAATSDESGSQHESGARQNSTHDVTDEEDEGHEVGDEEEEDE